MSTVIARTQRHEARAPVALTRRAPSPVERRSEDGLRAVLHTQGARSKLVEGGVHDALEVEADAVAEHVTRAEQAAPVAALYGARIRGAPKPDAAEPRLAPLETDEAEEQDSPSGEYLVQMSPWDAARQPDDVSESAAAQVRRVLSGGAALPSPLRASLEPHFGEDFSRVRIHVGEDAQAAAGALRARAFTVGEHVAFNKEQYDPVTREGRRLLAHELTHVVQQRGGSSRVQRWSLAGFLAEKAWDIVRDYAPGLEPILRKGPMTWLTEKLGGAFRGLFDRFARLDPTGTVERLSEAFTALVDRGSAILEGLAAGDCKPMFAAIRDLRGLVTDLAARAWERLNEALTPIGDFFSEMWAGYGAPTLEWLRSFAGDVWGGIQQMGRDIWAWTKPFRETVSGAWSWVKRRLFGADTDGADSEQGLVGWITAKASEAWAWVKEQTRPVWTPIADAAAAVRELVPPAFVRDFGESMKQLSRDLGQAAQSTGAGVAENREALASLLPSIQDILGFVRNGIVGARTTIVGGIAGITSRLTGLVGHLRANAILAPLAGALGWLETAAQRLIGWAQEKVRALFGILLRGFDLLSPIVERVLGVARQVITVVGDLMRLPGLVLGALWRLIPECIRNPIREFLVEQILKRIPVFSSLLKIPDLWARVQETAYRIVRQVFVDGDLAGAAWTYFSSLLRLIGIPPDLVQRILAKAAGAIGDILVDPIGFLTNTLRAMRLGFELFFGNIGQHLLGGVTGWLFAQMREAGIAPPEDLSLRSVLGVVMRILDISVERIFKRLEERGHGAIVERLRGALEIATGAWAWVATLVREGPAGLWRDLEDRLSSLWDDVRSAVIGWLSNTIVARVTARLLLMLDPSGIMPVINSLIALYRAIESFARYIREMLEIVESALDGVESVAKGVLDTAAQFLEGALARALPIAIGFLANQVGLGDLGGRIREIVEGVREKIDAAIDWLIDRAIATGGAVAGALRGGVARVREWWSARKRFVTPSGESHELYFTGTGGAARLVVASRPQACRDLVNARDVASDPAKTAAKSAAIRILDAIDGHVESSEGSRGSTTPSRGTGGERSTDAASSMAEHLDLLALQLALLFPSHDKRASTPPVFGSLYNRLYGTWVMVERLSNAHESGSPPDTTNPGWEALRRRATSGGATYYVRGHLLHHKLGGTGKDWLNLTPLTQQANRSASDSMFNGFEKMVLKRVEESATVNFIVTAHYTLHDRRRDVERLRTSRSVEEDKKAAIEDVIEAERHVPDRLRCEAYDVNDDGRRGQLIVGHDVHNDIETDPDSYKVRES